MNLTWAIGGAGAALAALTALAPTPARAQPAEAYVLAVQGTWTMPGRTLPLAVGTALPAAARLVARQPAVGDRIVVVAARSGTVLLAHECAEPRACRLPLVLPAAPVPASPSWTDSLRRVMARLEGVPDRYVATMSRHDAALPDAVLPLGDDVLELAPMLGALPSGRYEFALQPLDCAGAAGCAERLQVLDWARGHSMPIAGAMSPGIYELRVRPAAAPTTLAPRRARLLLVAAAGAAAKLDRYGSWLALTQGWGEAADEASRQALLWAVMDDLAASP